LQISYLEYLNKNILVKKNMELVPIELMIKLS
jgi:hypothetical protein